MQALWEQCYREETSHGCTCGSMWVPWSWAGGPRLCWPSEIISIAQTTTEKDKEERKDTGKGKHEVTGLRWELRHPDCRQHGLAKVSNGFSTHCAFPWLQRICAVDLSSHGHSDLRKLFVWGLPPLVQILLYTGPNSRESGPKLTIPNQRVTMIHPFLNLTQWKGFLIEFPYV